MVFPVVMYGCESWTIKKTECGRIDAFELWCWRRLESPLDCKEIQPVHPKGNQFEYSLEGLMLKLQYFGYLMWRTDSLEKILMLGKIEGRRRRGQQRMRWLDSITDSMDMNLSKPQETVKDRGAWRAAVHGIRVSNNKIGRAQSQPLHCQGSPHTTDFYGRRDQHRPAYGILSSSTRDQTQALGNTSAEF